jgi:hypothetical protein
MMVSTYFCNKFGIREENSFLFSPTVERRFGDNLEKLSPEAAKLPSP